ncbi:hypothetical protein EYC80_001975 [Monilinia laxa]|uniref:MT-A70-domain-containing protein n=1 Tax=Monilinia laxa TaxID=61186 RepID=A0A5N6K6M7_MONLA|nr:hypothetical protein EYC80_001975 [Monilinia laxa]
MRRLIYKENYIINAPEKTIEELMLERYVQLALDEMKRAMKGQGTMCLDRVLGKNETQTRKRKSAELGKFQQTLMIESNNMLPKRVNIDESTATMPPKSKMIHGNIPEASFHVENRPDGFPRFHLIVMDPPWPNRSALRKDAYAIASGFLGIESLLKSLPCNHIESNGYMGIWITNKPAFRAMLLDPGGLFDQWGLELVEEWIWLKITTSGEPIYKIAGTWRKPWEILLVGRKKCFGKREFDFEKGPATEEEMGVEKQSGGDAASLAKQATINQEHGIRGSPTASPKPNKSSELSENTLVTIKRRIIFGVPDLHSRKPNLKYLFGQLLGLGDYMGLEIFARNLTAGWWGWGNEVMKFQMDRAWAEGEGEADAAEPVASAPVSNASPIRKPEEAVSSVDILDEGKIECRGEFLASECFEFLSTQGCYQVFFNISVLAKQSLLLYFFGLVCYLSKVEREEACAHTARYGD